MMVGSGVMVPIYGCQMVPSQTHNNIPAVFSLSKESPVFYSIELKWIIKWVLARRFVGVWNSVADFILILNNVAGGMSQISYMFSSCLSNSQRMDGKSCSMI